MGIFSSQSFQVKQFQKTIETPLPTRGSGCRECLVKSSSRQRPEFPFPKGVSPFFHILGSPDFVTYPNMYCQKTSKRKSFVTWTKFTVNEWDESVGSRACTKTSSFVDIQLDRKDRNKLPGLRGGMQHCILWHDATPIHRYNSKLEVIWYVTGHSRGCLPNGLVSCE